MLFILLVAWQNGVLAPWKLQYKLTQTFLENILHREHNPLCHSLIHSLNIYLVSAVTLYFIAHGSKLPLYISLYIWKIHICVCVYVHIYVHICVYTHTHICISSNYTIIYKITTIMCKMKESYAKLKKCQRGGSFLNWKIKERFLGNPNLSWDLQEEW